MSRIKREALLDFIEFKSFLKQKALQNTQSSEWVEKIATDITMPLNEAFLESFENEDLSDNDYQFLKSAIADGLNGQVKNAEKVFSRLESKYQALENGFSL